MPRLIKEALYSYTVCINDIDLTQYPYAVEKSFLLDQPIIIEPQKEPEIGLLFKILKEEE